ncbi:MULTISPECIES: hypothetical protein [unclassified Gemella]|uniref:hypothetical protein n=1 Tax=Gemella sp. oral taxon 928 TaxID=1785995 RepID=UPI000AC85D5F|nr:hypothetical protein [Gemella sp. oral taxon 928]
MTLDKINKILIMLVIMAFTFVIGMYVGGYHTGKNLQKVANQNLEDRLKNYQSKEIK